MRPRTGFWIWVATFIALIILQHTRLRPFPHILLLFWILLPAGALVHLWSGKRNLATRWGSPGEFGRRDPFPVHLSVTNRSRFSTLVITTHDGDHKIRVPVASGTEETLVFAGQSEHTGAYRLPDRNVYLNEPFALFRASLSFPQSTVWILPYELDRWTDRSEGLRGQSPRTAPFRDGRDETAHVETHTRGKPMRHIHWKLSARMQQWLTRHMDDETDPTLLIAILGPEHSSEEARDRSDLMYDYAYTLARLSLLQRTPIRLFTKGRPTEVYSRPEQIRLVRRLLAMLAAEPVQRRRILRNISATNQSAIVLADTLDTDTENELLSLNTRVHRLTAVLFDEPKEAAVTQLSSAGIAVIQAGGFHDTV